MLQNTESIHLRSVAACHIACFPGSLSSKLGLAYVQKTLEWFLVNPRRFLYHVTIDGKVAGYCGGFVPVKIGDGSSSGMLQHAFNEAIFGIIKKPWLLLHQEVRPHYKFLWLNIKRKFTGKTIPISSSPASAKSPSHVGLVVIGVHPDFRGKGVAEQLAIEFEKRARSFDRSELILSVKTDNARAIGAYKKLGWQIKSEENRTYIMNKHINIDSVIS